jgi:peroxisomal 2,4-dienoyl-CoA reductase
MSKCAFNSLKNGGCIINISATLHYGASPFLTHASAAKAGIDALTRGKKKYIYISVYILKKNQGLAMEWNRYGIRVNAIAPGPIESTEGMDRLAPKGQGKKEYEV